MNRFKKLVQSIKELGIEPLWLYGRYQIGLRSGLFRKKTPIHASSIINSTGLLPLYPIPDVDQIIKILGTDGYSKLLDEADQIVNNRLYAYFDGEAREINLQPISLDQLQHWTAYESGKAKLPQGDIKFVWEPARFGWAFPLARAYHVTRDLRYREMFWRLLEEFNTANLAMLGSNWSSAQEVSIRMIAIVLVGAVFLRDDPDEVSHRALIDQVVNDHARRIPPTLIYARSQQNNHLITEALGLMVAGAIMEHAKSAEWLSLGKKWLFEALRTQIDDDGEYSQHSNNYHRLMLQCVILADRVLKITGCEWPHDVFLKLQAATRWLASEVDGETGKVSNYGHNDGAYIFPMDQCGYSDYRSVVRAARKLFLNQAFFPAGPWDEYSLWMGIQETSNVAQSNWIPSPSGLKQGNVSDWIRLRSVNYNSRPGHADQLHLDVWHHGVQAALDAGTYLYNGEAPWENSLMTTMVHNTVSVDDTDQMTRAGRFLWLNWSESLLIKPGDRGEPIVAEHNGYRRLGIIHRREVTRTNNGWAVNDTMQTNPLHKTEAKEHEFKIQWLLPDGEWTLDAQKMTMKLDTIQFELDVAAGNNSFPGIVQVCRAGEVIYGKGDCLPQMGWISPFYGVKLPAISFSVAFHAQAPFEILSKWRFTD
ncbi:MAG: heparinase II/III family protein [Anaerolineaceae bacterium]|nr:heparinase II/III family protein [Anaerolineaceae bacterium]